MTDRTGVGTALSEDDAVIAALLGFRMMAADAALHRAARDRGARTEACDMAADELLARLMCPDAHAAPWRHDLARRLAYAGTRDARLAQTEQAAATAGRWLPTRARRLAVLVELVTLEPWPTGITWTPGARERGLDDVVADLGEVSGHDRRAVEHELALLLPRQRDTSPGSGAECLRRWEEVARDAARLAMHTRLVTIGERGDVRTARRVEDLLERRLDAATVRLIEITTTLLPREGAGGAQRETLLRERDYALRAEDTLRAALERLRAMGVTTDDAY